MTLSGVFEFDAKDLIYQYHFPKVPVVPGVLIIRSFIQQLQNNQAGEEFIIDHFSFAHFAAPTIKYEFQIEKAGDSYTCLMRRDNKIYAKGKISKLFR
jgi:3-hydroxymyristoyl/3-hydroxydecanoyl-(acyl carrier protein) dehydratase